MALAPPGLIFTSPTDLQASFFVLSVAALSILDRFAPRPDMNTTANTILDDGSTYLSTLTRRAAFVLIVTLGIAAAVFSSGGCAPKVTVPPTNDRIGSLKEATDEQNKSIDQASASNKSVLQHLRDARDAAYKLFPNYK